MAPKCTALRDVHEPLRKAWAPIAGAVGERVRIMSVPLAPGSRLGEYEIVSLLGVGGMGEVYRARDARLQRDVALKLLPELWAADPDRRDRFRREALAVAALNHPHIVTIHSVEDAGSTVFLTMELVSGRSLASALQSGPLLLERILTIGIAIADAVSAAHQKGITHRDLKPANIILGEGEHAGRVKVVDFGLAKAIAPGVDRESGRRSGDRQLADVHVSGGDPARRHPRHCCVHVSRTSRGKSG